MLSIKELEKLREERGLKIVNNKDGQVKRIDDSTYEVLSQSGNGVYLVSKLEDGWVCECPDHQFRGLKCKHAYAVEFSLALRRIVEVSRIEPIVNPQVCQICGSRRVVRDGVRRNERGDIQVYYCKDCIQHFTVNLGFEKMKASPQVITSAMQLYFTGESLRNVQKFLKLQGVNVSHVAVYKWIRKYVGLMEKYLDKITPQVSNTWRADELYVKIKGNMKYLFALMDDETRFWIAQEVAETKHTHDARNLFQMGVRVTGKKPKTLITDGLPAYHDAYFKEYWTHEKETRTEHIRKITIKGEVHNNKMERFNGEVRDREKVMRGLKKENTPILKGYQIFHNYIRPHEGLNGKTPSEACGIEVKGENKWITLIQNASHKGKNRTS